MNDKEYINQLKEIIKIKYGIIVDKINPGNRGNEAETWVIDCSNKKYFVKIIFHETQLDNYINGLKINNFLSSINKENINNIIKTLNDEIYINFNGGILALFNFIEGEVDYNYSYDKIIKLLIPIYKIDISEHLNDYLLENYDIKSIIKKIDKCYLKLDKNDKLKLLLDEYHDEYLSYNKKYAKYAKLIDKNSKKVITHGDICQNIMVSNPIKIIDWDESLIAPIERDCWSFINNIDQFNTVNQILKENNIDYKLDKNMLCYYSIKNAFIYLLSGITKYIKNKNEDELYDFKEIFAGWVNKKINILENLNEEIIS